MSQLEFKRSLRTYGLTDKEIAVYLAVLGLDSATVREIALATKIKRTSVYLVADKLVTKSILGSYKAKYGTHYVASSPQSLLTRLEDIKTEIAGIIPQLEAIKKKDLHEPSVNFYRGKQGYLTVLNASLESYSHEVLYLGSAEALNQIISEQYVTEKYIPERLKRKIVFKQIVFADSFSQDLKQKDDMELRKIKYLPESHAFEGNMLIFHNSVAYFSSRRELACVLIESQDIAKMEREKYRLLWERL